MRRETTEDRAFDWCFLLCSFWRHFFLWKGGGESGAAGDGNGGETALVMGIYLGFLFYK
jgi:hypothetical protein